VYQLKAGRPVAPVLSLHDDLYNRRVLQHEKKKCNAKKVFRKIELYFFASS